jgi:AcrR family transcriptional regulator
VTTGALYHHFGGKPGLYAFVREEAERRILDRMEGAAAAVSDQGPVATVRAALLVGFDAAVRQEVALLIAVRGPSGAPDPIVALLARFAPEQDPIRARILGAAWREALHEAARWGTGGEHAERVARARAALIAVLGI